MNASRNQTTMVAADATTSSAPSRTKILSKRLSGSRRCTRLGSRSSPGFEQHQSRAANNRVKATNVPRAHPDARIFRIDLVASSGKVAEVQTAWAGWGKMVWGPEGVVAQLGGPAVMIRGGSRRVWCHSVRRRLGGCR